MYISLKEQNKCSYKNYKYYLKRNISFNINQVLKILIFYDVKNFSELFKINKCNKVINFMMNFFSYHILKLINLLNLNEFLRLYCSNDNKKNIICKKYDLNKYLIFLIYKLRKEEVFLNEQLKKSINKKFNLSLRMSKKIK